MRIKNGLAVLAGAVALACSGGAMAQTSAGPNGTIFINIVDTTSGTSFLFDTGLLVSSFTGSTSYSVNLATNSSSSSAYAAFVASEKGSSDTIDYSVVGNYAVGSAPPPPFVTLATATSTPTPATGAQGYQAAGQIQAFLGTNINPAGGATFFASTSTTQWNSGYEAGLQTDGISDNTLVGNAIGFYAITTTANNSRPTSVSVSPFASTWDLTSAGVLTYGSGSPVPLPTPLLLMLSGLGLLGLVGRRKQSSDFNGAAA